ncbi:SpoIIE family protein phosphatase [Candidatus Albibeggiatoa sp. nov. NOAA]|uniref:SpoIIE family protein phosphatase n=1 Tax=Candidatus Albibeggiatoa sp. nov. NOAA TaxID=3162724 RepID=UPI003301A80D|nr:SpoIIE family protein phosphatase [Thiotrichaceae bacterium]
MRGQTINPRSTYFAKLSLAQYFEAMWSRFNLETIGAKLLFSLLIGIFSGLLGLSYYFYQALEKHALAEVQNRLQIQSLSLEKELRTLEEASKNMSIALFRLKKLGINSPQAYKQLAFDFFLERSPLAVGAGFGQAPYQIISEQEGFWPYFYVDQGEANAIGQSLSPPYANIRYAELFQEDNYLNQAYYLHTVETGKLNWTEPFSWYGIAMSTLLAPFYDENNQLIGVAGYDVNVTALTQKLDEPVLNQDGHFVLFSKQGHLLANPYQPEQAKAMAHYTQLPFFQPIWGKMQYSFDNLFTYQDTYVAHQHIPNTNWVIAAILPEKTILYPIYQMIGISMLVAIIFLTSIVILFVRWLNCRLVPILNECQKLDIDEADEKLRMQRFAHQLTTGEWGQKLPVQSHDEFGKLSRTFKGMAGQLSDLFRNLDMKVKERTEELEQANEEIKTLNDYLKEENVRMSTELLVSQELQRMVLPKEEELQNIDDLEICGFMQPAAEVGGDYYDVLQYRDNIKIAIGDVTGHGLASGVLMLMVQTSVRTLFANDICSPDTCLNILNRAIYENIKRMDSDKNLSLALVDYCKGKVKVSGQHEEVLLVRHDGKIERIDTIDLGFPIGLEADIEPFLNHVEIELQPGDGLVLYTDGITEAENMSKQLYGLERLCDVVSKAWHCNAKEIQLAVIEDVRAHIGQQKIFDDITLVILKQR